MERRGPPSADERAMREAIERGVMLPGSRLPPPDGLTDEEVAEWQAVIMATPPGWIAREHEGVFRDFIRHTIIAKHLGEKIARSMKEVLDLPPEDERSVALTNMTGAYRAETSECVRLARSLRLTRQAQRQDRAAGTANRKTTAKPKPWNDWGVDRPGATKSQ